MKEKMGSRYGELFRAAKFGIAGVIGFLVVETILTLGIFSLYGNLNAPSVAYSSPTLLALNIGAFGIGVTISFFVNESITVRNQVRQRKTTGSKNVIVPLLKFQLVYLAGNAITIGVQLGFLKAFSLSPVLGNVIGAIVAFPVSYFISMRYVWKIYLLRTNDQPVLDSRQPLKASEMYGMETSSEDVQSNVQSLLQQFASTFGNYKISIQEYKCNILTTGNNGISIDFVLKMNVLSDKKYL